MSEGVRGEGQATAENMGHTCESDGDCVSGRACTYYGYCHDISDIEPNGEQFARKRRYVAGGEPSGYDVEVLKEAFARLKYNYTITVHRAPTPLPQQSQGLGMRWRSETEPRV